jgi:SSS family solute:Na+ symporter
VWVRYVRPGATEAQESGVAKITSLVVKLGALAFIIFIPLQYAINLQLLGGLWILQTLPAIVFGLYTRWFHARALFAGWLVGMVVGTSMAASQGFASIYPLHVFGAVWPAYAAVYALIANLVVATIFTPVCDALRVPRAVDAVKAGDFVDRGLDTVPLIAS